MKFGCWHPALVAVLSVASASVGVGPLGTEAFTIKETRSPPSQQQQQKQLSRREWFGQSSSTMAALTIASTSPLLFPDVATASTNDYLQELQASKSKLQDIPNLLQEQEW
jgi:hypothetical protein